MIREGLRVEMENVTTRPTTASPPARCVQADQVRRQPVPVFFHQQLKYAIIKDQLRMFSKPLDRLDQLDDI